MSRLPTAAASVLPTHSPPLTDVNVAWPIHAPETRGAADGVVGDELPHAADTAHTATISAFTGSLRVLILQSCG